MPFSVGDKVRAKNDPSRVGMVEGIGQHHAGAQFYHVFFGAQGTRTLGEFDLLAHTSSASPIDSLRAGIFSGYAEFQRMMTLQRLMRDKPLRNNIYAFNATRTQFYPYQFKPLLKFLGSANNRILICDEVGLGKTIEAGLLLIELRARQALRNVLIVCPSNLRHKWRLELRQRFGEDFKILDGKELRRYLDDYEERGDVSPLNAIVSYDTARSNPVREQLRETGVPFDFVVFDEAHHLRNFGRKQREVGELLTSSAQAVVMLTATPVHLGQANLFSLLNLLDPDDFPDLESALERFRDNEQIVNAQRALASVPPDFTRAALHLELALPSRWQTRHSLIESVQAKLADANMNAVGGDDRTYLVSLQRDLNDLNLLSHILTRTRKRDVHTRVVERRATSVTVKLSSWEKALYDAITNEIRQKSTAAGDNEGALAWRLTTPQRRFASSIHGMVDFYRGRHRLGDEADDPDWTTRSSEGEDDEGEAGPTGDVAQIIRDWPANARDSKYDELRRVLLEVRGGEVRPRKVLVFATFLHTIRYLYDRLTRDGVGVVAISSDTPVDQRPAEIARFRDDDSIEVMLSSRVGSEGLDFQFCSTLVNYDLPWNPMEVEQRIGRLDRIGQEANRIVIVNLWTEGTIEEKILRRLYDRIEIFKNSVGDLEAILGDVSATVQRELMYAALHPDEVDRAVEQVARVIADRRASVQELEATAAQFVGVDSFFDDEVESIRRKRRYVTGEQLCRFVQDFLKSNAPRTRLDYDRDSNSGVLVPDAALRDFLRHRKRAGEALAIAGAVGAPVHVTFDSQVAFNRPNIEFLNVVHPLILAIAEHLAEDGASPAAQHVAIRTTALASGFYLFFVYRITLTAARGGTSLEAVFCTPDGKIALSGDDAETLLAEMVERGESPAEALEVDEGFAERAIVAAEQKLIDRLALLTHTETQANDAFVDQRLASLRSFFDKSIGKRKELLRNAQQSGKQPKYIRMLTSHVARLETEYAQQADALEARRKVSSEYESVASGILEVTA